MRLHCVLGITKPWKNNVAFCASHIGLVISNTVNMFILFNSIFCTLVLTRGTFLSICLSLSVCPSTHVSCVISQKCLDWFLQTVYSDEVLWDLMHVKQKICSSRTFFILLSLCIDATTRFFSNVVYWIGTMGGYMPVKQILVLFQYVVINVLLSNFDILLPWCLDPLTDFFKNWYSPCGSTC